MTTNGTWLEDLSSDVWGEGKSMEPMTPEEELAAWRRTTRALDSLCGMADGLMLEPLILALADAFNRAREEERRAEDRLSRPEGAELGPREEERLMTLMRRSDAFNNALIALEGQENAYPDVKAGYIGVCSRRRTGRRTSSSGVTAPRSASPTAPARSTPASQPSDHRRGVAGYKCTPYGPGPSGLGLFIGCKRVQW